MGFDLQRAAVVTGDGIVARFPGVLVVGWCTDREPLRRLLELCADVAGPDPGRALARRLVTWLAGPDAPGDGLVFGTVAAAGEHLAVFLSGTAGVEVAGTGITVSGTDSASWTDRLLARPDTALVLALDGSAASGATDVALFDLRAGVVPGAGVVLLPAAGPDAGTGRSDAGGWAAGRADAPSDPGPQPVADRVPAGHGGYGGEPGQGLPRRESRNEARGEPSMHAAGRRALPDDAPVYRRDPNLPSRRSRHLSTATPSWSAEPAAEPEPEVSDAVATPPVGVPTARPPSLDEAMTPPALPTSAPARIDAPVNGHAVEEPEAPESYGDQPYPAAAHDGNGHAPEQYATGTYEAENAPRHVNGHNGYVAEYAGEPDMATPLEIPEVEIPEAIGGEDFSSGEWFGADEAAAQAAADGPDHGGAANEQMPDDAAVWTEPNPTTSPVADGPDPAEAPAGVPAEQEGYAAEEYSAQEYPAQEYPGQVEAEPSEDGAVAAGSGQYPPDEVTSGAPGEGGVVADADRPRPPLRAEQIMGVAPTEAPRPPLEAGPSGPTVQDGTNGDGGTIADEPQAQGHLCARGHLNDPRSHFCVLCGIRMNERTGVLVMGSRPPLGLLVFDDGATYTVDAEYLVGRMPEADPRVRAGSLRSIVIEDRTGAVSRVHAEIRVSGWDVLLSDSGSRNGTFVAGASETGWTPLAPGRGRRLVPGTRVRIGGRSFVFESPSGVR
ncbi:FHA domain-containing protein [Pseudonocardia sp. GCM10023141]|uniref:FHA domain-containing protein n=1 Tax=Pseudonocardia sp. GCM10023141 TaxID=3252653 RepID=UPI0036173CDF